MKTVLALFLAFLFMAAGSAQSHPIDQTPSDGSVPGVDEIELGVTPDMGMPCIIDGKPGRQFGRHHCIEIKKPISGADLRKLFKEKYGVESRTIIGVTRAPLAWYQPDPKCDGVWRCGSHADDFSDYRDWWWSRNYASNPGQDHSGPSTQSPGAPGQPSTEPQPSEPSDPPAPSEPAPADPPNCS